MEYLTEIGPDTLVPCFTVNLKGNKSIDVCNSINMAIFQDLSHSDGEKTVRRIPMLVTSSSMLHHKHSTALKSFKKRLGVRKHLLITARSPCYSEKLLKEARGKKALVNYRALTMLP